jgi:[protein-PII] uridylyltransferase
MSAHSPIPLELVQKLNNTYASRLQAIREAFDFSADGTKTVADRSALADEVVTTVFRSLLGADAKGIAVLAVGGYGRGQLFPYSDVDLLCLCASKAEEKRYQEPVRSLSQALWDLNFRLSATTRTLDECEKLNPENSEFAFALLDARALAGDPAVLNRFFAQSLPQMVQRERDAMMARIIELTRLRHEKFGNTLFHLEPNVKDGPGGMRDLHVCAWLARLAASPGKGSQRKRSNNLASEFEAANSYLTAIRCFLHYRAGRDDNTLYWQAQDAAAGAHIGVARDRSIDAPSWMRTYFRHARDVQRLVTQSMEESESTTISIYQHVRRWRSQPRASEFRVQHGRILPRDPLTPGNVLQILALFRGCASEGLPLDYTTEESITDLLPSLAAQLPPGDELWLFFQFLLQAPHAGLALRSMHALGVLELLLPEFHGIDALVVRDAYHRYTVDEHTFLLLDHLHRLEHPVSEIEKRFDGLLKEIERPELLYFAALMHDTGKGRNEVDHTLTSANMADAVLERFGADEAARQAVRQLIQNHLEMSAALRKDIFDAETVRAFAKKVGSPELLRMLTLLTYADIQSVNPDALTSWKADAIWQLYMAASNYLDRSIDEERVEADAESAHITRMLSSNHDQGVAIVHFLAGLPRRYLRTRSAEELRAHFALAAGLKENPVGIITQKLDDAFETTLVTQDRPFLFSDIAGALAAQGMNIVKADAFANNAGVVVDTFRFSDPFATLSQNPEEIPAFEDKLRSAVLGQLQIDRLLKSRVQGRRRRPQKRLIETQLHFDNESSSHSTLLYVIAQDTPGLLYRLSRTLAEHGCDIGVALIDTEGEQAMDVFYLTADGAKLGAGRQTQLMASLQAAFEGL